MIDQTTLTENPLYNGTYLKPSTDPAYAKAPVLNTTPSVFGNAATSEHSGIVDSLNALWEKSGLQKTIDYLFPPTLTPEENLNQSIQIADKYLSETGQTDAKKSLDSIGQNLTLKDSMLPYQFSHAYKDEQGYKHVEINKTELQQNKPEVNAGIFVHDAMHLLQTDNNEPYTKNSERKAFAEQNKYFANNNLDQYQIRGVEDKLKYLDLYKNVTEDQTPFTSPYLN